MKLLMVMMTLSMLLLLPVTALPQAIRVPTRRPTPAPEIPDGVCLDFTLLEDPISKLVAKKACESKLVQMLLAAATEGNINTVEEILALGASIESSTERGETPLTIAAQNDYVELAQYLIKRGAKVNTQDKAKKTPLIFAAQYGHQKIFRALLEAGADPSTEYAPGKNALTWSINRGDFKSIKMLIDRGAKLNEQDTLGFTPIIRAIRAYKSNLMIVKILLDNGADPKIRSNEGLDAVDYANQLNRREYLEVLFMHNNNTAGEQGEEEDEEEGDYRYRQ